MPLLERGGTQKGPMWDGGRRWRIVSRSREEGGDKEWLGENVAWGEGERERQRRGEEKGEEGRKERGNT